MLGRLFTIAIDDASHADVHDKALFYYRLLETDVNMARQVVIGSSNSIVSFTEEESAEFRDRLFSEFNTLSVIYQKPSERFIVKGPAVLGAQDESDDEDYDDDDQIEEESDVDESSDSGTEDGMSKRIQRRLLDDNDNDHADDGGYAQHDEGTYSVDGLLDLGFGSSSTSRETMMASQPSLLKTNPAALTPMVYQQTWLDGKLHEMRIALQLQYRPPAKEVEAALKRHHIECIASNERANPIMFYFYAQPAGSDNFLLVESKIHSTGQMENLVKHVDRELLEPFASEFKQAMASYL